MFDFFDFAVSMLIGFCVVIMGGFSQVSFAIAPIALVLSLIMFKLIDIQIELMEINRKQKQ